MFDLNTYIMKSFFSTHFFSSINFRVVFFIEESVDIYRQNKVKIRGNHSAATASGRNIITSDQVGAVLVVLLR